MILQNLFDKKFDGAWYIPENAEDSNDRFTFTDLEKLCEDEWQASKLLQYKFSDPEHLLEYMITFIEWEFPSTFIEELKNFD